MNIGHKQQASETGTQELIGKLSQAPAAASMLSGRASFALWLGIAVLSLGVGVISLGVRSDFSLQLSSPLYLFEVLAPLILSIGSAYLAIQLRRPDSDLSSWKFFSITGLFGLSLLSLLTFFCMECFSSGQAFQLYLTSGMTCFLGVALLSLLPSGFLFWLASQGAPTQLFRVSLLSSLSGVSLATLSVNLYCGVDQSFHHIIWIALPALALVALGASYGQKWLRW